MLAGDGQDSEDNHPSEPVPVAAMPESVTVVPEAIPAAVPSTSTDTDSTAVSTSVYNPYAYLSQYTTASTATG